MWLILIWAIFRDQFFRFWTNSATLTWNEINMIPLLYPLCKDTRNPKSTEFWKWESWVLEFTFMAPPWAKAILPGIDLIQNYDLWQTSVPMTFANIDLNKGLDFVKRHCLLKCRTALQICLFNLNVYTMKILGIRVWILCVSTSLDGNIWWVAKLTPTIHSYPITCSLYRPYCPKSSLRLNEKILVLLFVCLDLERTSYNKPKI